MVDGVVLQGSIVVCWAKIHVQMQLHKLKTFHLLPMMEAILPQGWKNINNIEKWQMLKESNWEEWNKKKQTTWDSDRENETRTAKMFWQKCVEYSNPTEGSNCIYVVIALNIHLQGQTSRLRSASTQHRGGGEILSSLPLSINLSLSSTLNCLLNILYKNQFTNLSWFNTHYSPNILLFSPWKHYLIKSTCMFMTMTTRSSGLPKANFHFCHLCCFHLSFFNKGL